MIPLSYRPGGNMNILLISLPEKNKDMKLEATEVLPLALYSLSSVLKCQGYEVSIIDPCEFVYLDEKENAETTCVTLIEECLEEGYDIVGFSVNTFNWGITKTVVNQISWKKNTIYKSILAENSDNISYNLSKILKRKVRKIFSQTVHSNNTKTNLYSRYISLGVIKCTTIFKLYLQI